MKWRGVEGGRHTRGAWTNRHRTQKWRSTTQPATASTKRPPLPGTADPAVEVEAEEGAKEACLADWHSRQGGSLYSRLASSSWPAWPGSAPDFSPWSGSRASSTSSIHGKLSVANSWHRGLHFTPIIYFLYALYSFNCFVPLCRS